MLRPLHMIKGFTLAATDDTIGRVKDFLFDEEHWTVRYMVADTGRWIPRRKVLISPVSLDKPDWNEKAFYVNLTKQQIKDQPDLDSDAPVSRRHEKKWFESYEYPYYWRGSFYAWGYGVTPPALFNSPSSGEEESSCESMNEESCLRSLEEVRKYHVIAKDGEIGRVEDLVMDDETWTIRYVMVNTDRGLPGTTVILSPKWFEAFDWREKTLRCSLLRDTIESSPPFNPTNPIRRRYEEDLHTYYAREPYWGVTG
jgi:sporulation protein YlmC with PRC-barrel domain